MPRAFSAKEEILIRDHLIRTGRDLFARQGVRRTSVEQLSSGAGIAKGSFYKFYLSKEVLFFEILEQIQASVRAPLIDPTSSNERADFVEALKLSITAIKDQPLLSIVTDQQSLGNLARKLPSDILDQHEKQDQEFVRRLIMKWNRREKRPPRNEVASHLALILLIQFSPTVLGDRLYPHAERALITSFTSCFFPD